MTFFKNVSKPLVNNKGVKNYGLAKIWWWRHIPNCGKIVIEPEAIIRCDNIVVVFVNERNQQWYHVLSNSSDQPLATLIDYTKLVDDNNKKFIGKLRSVIVKWDQHQQQFIPDSDFIKDSNSDLSLFSAV